MVANVCLRGSGSEAVLRKFVMDNLLHELQRRDHKVVEHADDLLVTIEDVRRSRIAGMGSECMARDECRELKCGTQDEWEEDCSTVAQGCCI